MVKRKIDKYLKEGNSNTLTSFAFLGGKDRFNQIIEKLKETAESEPWNVLNEDIPNKILYSYLIGTFDKCLEEDKILVNNDETYSCFNTGLLTPHGEDIIGIFSKSTPSPNATVKDPCYWFLEGFYADSDWKVVNNFAKLPQVCTYFKDPKDLLFDVKANISVNYNHILDDHWEERFPQELKLLGKNSIISMIIGALEITKKRVERNHRLVIPLYYNKKITYLLPIILGDHCLALAIEKLESGNYRANTIFTVEMAYSNARLLMKPETNWLVIE